MLTTLAQRPLPRALPLGLDLGSNPAQDPEASADWPWLAGFPAPAPADIEQSLNLNEHLIRHPEATFLMRVTGDRWTEAGLHDGDLLVMDRVIPPLAGSVALAVVEGVSVLTRLSRDAQGRLRVQAAGTDLSRPPDDAITIAGVARWVIHRLWPGRLGS